VADQPVPLEGVRADEGEPVTDGSDNPFIRESRSPRGTRQRTERRPRRSAPASEGLDPASLPPAIGVRSEPRRPWPPKPRTGSGRRACPCGRRRAGAQASRPPAQEPLAGKRRGLTRPARKQREGARIPGAFFVCSRAAPWRLRASLCPRRPPHRTGQ
jgi:hypothetical protein